MPESNDSSVDEEYDQLRRKRLSTLIGVWDYLLDNNLFDKERFRLSIPLTNEIIEHYLIDQRVLKQRYKIKERIQPPKIAGLMASLILRYRPILPLFEEFTNDKEAYVNEFLAVFHGLAICGEFDSYTSIKEIVTADWFSKWLNDFLYLLHHRNHTPEALAFIYETFAIFKFPSAISDLSRQPNER